MKLRRNENKAWVALAFFVVALLFTIGLSLSLYAQARREKEAQLLTQYRLQAALLSSLLSQSNSEIPNSTLYELLQTNKIIAQAALYSPNGELLSAASTTGQSIDPMALKPAEKPSDGSKPAFQETSGSPSQGVAGVTLLRKNKQLLAEIPLIKGSRVLVLAFPDESSSSSFTYYIFSYQVVALLIGLGLIFFLIRRLMRPYRRMVEAAQGSPIRASAAMSESEFVVETFQALIQQLQAKETELAQLHTLERRRAEKSERFSERLVANIPSGLVAINSKGLITSANKHALNLLNNSALANAFTSETDSEIHKQPINFGVFFNSAPSTIEMISKCLKTGEAFKREEVEIALPEGTPRRLGLSISPITDATQNIEGALCMMTDITEVTDLRERIKLQETLANLGEMAAGLAHEFKNSLATIQGYTQLFDVQSEASTPSQQRRTTLDSLLKEVDLLARLVTDFLNFARPQSLNFSLVDMQLLIEECVEEVRPQLERQEVSIAVKGQFISLPADESLLRRVFVNLIRNAAEAIDEDSERREIEVTGSMDKGTGKPYAHIRVSDTGCGISGKDLHNIFIPFFTTKSRGYGIGLAIVQKIIVAHGGDVHVERSDASGTVFHCRLPLHPSPLTT
jgi:signal transduction histidine kinase